MDHDSFANIVLVCQILKSYIKSKRKKKESIPKHKAIKRYRFSQFVLAFVQAYINNSGLLAGQQKSTMKNIFTFFRNPDKLLPKPNLPICNLLRP